MDMTPGSKHNDEHDEAQKKVFRGYGFRPGGIYIYTYAVYVVSNVASECVMYHVSIMYLQYLPSFCIPSMHGVNHFDHSSSFLGNVSNPIIPSTFVSLQK